MRTAIDTGGTFTDCVYLEDGVLKVLKLFSTPEDPGKAVLEAVRAVARSESLDVRHGTTVSTNTLLERKGARVAFVTTTGFEDTISIGRQARTNLYDWFASPPPSIVPPELRFGVKERTSPDGLILERPTAEQLAQLCERVRASGAQAIAISLLFSFANPENERLVAKALCPLGLPITLSHQIVPEFREFERASTITINAYLAPKVSSYMRGLENSIRDSFPASQFDVMQSSGGIIPARLAAEQPVRTVLSGPAGGVIGAFSVARLAGFEKIIAFDMGGTSTDVALVDGTEGGPKITNESVVAGMPVSVPMLEIHTVGAGGGSIARFDEAGILHVGPESAGCVPGPICYGRGTQPTVTDANVILGRLDPESFLGGQKKLDHQRATKYMDGARGSMGSVEQFAAGILLLAEAAMEKALRVISVERGYDPRDFTLVAFGGAGPLHACALAKALRIPTVLVPCMPGALSALGILLADTVRDFSKTVMTGPNPELLEPHFQELEKQAQHEAQPGRLRGTCSRSADLRYAGQGYELNVPAGPDMLASFHRTHLRRFGYADEQRQVEVVSIRMRTTVTAPAFKFARMQERAGDARHAILRTRPVIFEGKSIPTPIYERDKFRAGDSFSGPAIVTEYSATTVIPPDWKLRVDAFQNIVVEVN